MATSGVPTADELLRSGFIARRRILDRTMRIALFLCAALSIVGIALKFAVAAGFALFLGAGFLLLVILRLT